MALIAPSLLSADFLNLAADCRMLNDSAADWFHLDVMDGRFVPNISFGPMVVSFIRSATPKYCDVHLMIEEPERYAEAFKQAGADNLTVHVEACVHLHRNIQQIRSLDMHAGVAVNPHTPLDDIREVLGDVQLVCLMGVNPGFGGQHFIPRTLHKIEALKSLLVKEGLDVRIEIDGGVTPDNAADLIRAGADVLVAGNAVFRSTHPAETIARLKAL